MGEVEEEKHAEDRAGRSEAFLFISWTVDPRHKSINDDYSAKKTRREVADCASTGVLTRSPSHPYICQPHAANPFTII